MTNIFREIVIEDIAKNVLDYESFWGLMEHARVLRNQAERLNITKEVEAKIKEMKK